MSRLFQTNTVKLLPTRKEVKHSFHLYLHLVIFQSRVGLPSHHIVSINGKTVALIVTVLMRLQHQILLVCSCNTALSPFSAHVEFSKSSNVSKPSVKIPLYEKIDSSLSTSEHV